MTTIRFAVLVLSMLFLSACTSLEQLDAAREKIRDLQTQVQADIARIEQARADLPPGTPQARDADAALADLQAADQALSAMLQRLDAVVAESEHPSDPISQMVGMIAPWLPEPARTPALLGSALLVSLWRGYRLREGFRSVVEGFDRAMKDDPAFSKAFRRNAQTFRAIQTPAARRLVDQVQRRRHAGA